MSSNISIKVHNVTNLELNENTSVNIGHNDDTMIKLVIVDGTVYNIERKNAFLSSTIRHLAELNQNTREIYLDKIESKSVMDFMIEYMNHCKGVLKPEITAPLIYNTWKQNCNNDEFDAELSDRSYQNRTQHFEVMLAAHYLDLNPLLKLLCARFSLDIRDNQDDFKQVIYKGTYLEGKTEEELEIIRKSRDRLKGDIEMNKHRAAIRNGTYILGKTDEDIIAMRNNDVDNTNNIGQS